MGIFGEDSILPAYHTKLPAHVLKFSFWSGTIPGQYALLETSQVNLNFRFRFEDRQGHSLSLLENTGFKQ